MRNALLCTLLVAMPAVTGEEPPRGIASMGWLAGTWEGPMWGGRFVAHYSTPDGGKILSFSELRKGEGAAYYEFEVFQETADGVVFTPYPRGQRKETFRLASAEERKAVFDHPGKDFPTRIAYHRVADDRLVITLSDPHGGSDKTETFDLRRAAR